MLIREFAASDRTAAQMLLQQTSMQPGQIEHWLKQRHCLVASQDDAVVGLVALAPGQPGFYAFFILVEPGMRRQGIGSALGQQLMAALPADAEMICCPCPSQNVAGHAFLSAKAFAPWFTEELMHYTGPTLADPGLTVQPYTDADFEVWTGMINECFYPLRKAQDIRPHVIFKNDRATRQRLANSGNENLLFYDADQLVGLAGIAGSEIDPVAVAGDQRRKGYGRRITAYCTNQILSRGISPVTLTVAASNRAARQLYESVSYRVVEQFDWFRLLLK